jgi:3-hydroxyacyl-[acyl-carrier-protein] dehydratase
VLPGDTVTLEAVITRNSPRMCVADVVARVEGEVCAQATQKYVMAKVEEEGEQ